MRQSERLRAKQLRKSLSELEMQKEISRENHEKLVDYEVYEEDTLLKRKITKFTTKCVFYNNLLRVLKCLLQ